MNHTICEMDTLCRWGLQVHDMQHILGHAERECWLPDMVW